MGLLSRLTGGGEPTPAEVRAFKRGRPASAKVARAAAQKGSDKSPFQQARAAAKAADRAARRRGES